MASGTGSLFAHVIETIQITEVPIQVAALVTDKKNCGASQFAQKNQVPVHVFENWKAEARNKSCHEISQLFEQLQPDLILSLGFMRILSEHAIANDSGAKILSVDMSGIDFQADKQAFAADVFHERAIDFFQLADKIVPKLSGALD